MQYHVTIAQLLKVCFYGFPFRVQGIVLYFRLIHWLERSILQLLTYLQEGILVTNKNQEA